MNHVKKIAAEESFNYQTTNSIIDKEIFYKYFVNGFWCKQNGCWNN